MRIGTIKSSVVLGALLAQGIGDTLRVSLTGDPVEEVWVARQILTTLDLRSQGIRLISCPTCSRTQVDLISIAEEVEKRLQGVEKPLTVAIMGCEVNGPGEAREADLGVACGRHRAVLFKRGQIIRRIEENQIIDELLKEIDNWNPEK